MQSLTRSSSGSILEPYHAFRFWMLFTGLLIWIRPYFLMPCLGAPPTFSVTLAWDPSPSPEAVGYRLYFGVSSGQYTTSIQVGNISRYTLSGLNAGTAYYFAVRAYASNGLESDFSNEITSAADLPKLTPQVSESGAVHLTLEGLVSQRYQILTTQNFQNWQSIGTVITDENGTAEIIDSQAMKYPRRFYYPVEVGP